ncbi:heavy metal resistance protein CzcA [Enemella dayhoffiae]|uniref:Heavy metal resistance protein CzcA n=1 Tax=Enemella dayhoffiae TaxID=2016507 RepID=A0A255H721_9ACTN|nr:DEAD/DEAH box helicase [Enemella dayhoffiae]OYO23440.1 heavy metal resistance protein CzcA [Enemella dayhoffiae]
MSDLLPTTQVRRIQEALTAYLATTFALTDADAQDALSEFLAHEQTGIFKGPWVRLRVPFAPAEPGWQQHLDWMPEGFTPHGHQAEAFARLSTKPTAGLPELRHPEATLVTTGTGSGKTEAFLIPILDHVLRARSLGYRGIKALILYPMNALANDQAGRLAELIGTDRRLRSVTAGIYTGEQGERTTVSVDGLITSRRTMQQDPPDILLTNYKMLDQLLLRRDDQPLWQASADNLTYLVLDEFHTYDGAQGTDVAMLLRRLGLTLAAYRNDPDTQAESGPLGAVTPVATSATLGDGGDPSAMLSFAETVFGRDFPRGSIITETRLDLDDWARRWTGQADDPTATLNVGGMADSMSELEAATPAEVGRLLARQLGVNVHAEAGAEEVAGALLSAPAVRKAIAMARDATSLDSLARCIVARPDASGIAARWVGHLVAALSHLRTRLGQDFLNVETHLWVRELTRLDRLATSAASFRWSDDAEHVVDSIGAADIAYPALYCRYCGRSGWGVYLEPTGTHLAQSRDIRRRHAQHEKYFRALLYAPAEGERGGVEGLHWWDVAQQELTRLPPDETSEAYREGRVLPVLTHDRRDDVPASNDDCPSCQKRDGIRFLGSAIATQLSVSLSALFGSEEIDSDDKKALVFTDSVQDAAHRAGFVETRSHTFTLRAAIRDSLESHVTDLAHLVPRLVERAGNDPFARYRLLHPAIADRQRFKPYWDDPNRLDQVTRRSVETRLAFDVALEFGLQSGFGRTLENTGTAVSAVEIGTPAQMGKAARRCLDAAEWQPELGDGPAEQDLATWVRGVAEHMRASGAIDHPWLTRFIKSDGNRYAIWGGRPRGEGMPAFPTGRSAPEFPRVGTRLNRASEVLLENATSPQGWYASWASRVLGVSAGMGATLTRLLLRELAERGVLLEKQTESHAMVYAISPDRVLVRIPTDTELREARVALRCTVCHGRRHGTPEVIDQLEGAPCFLVRCPGRLGRIDVEPNFYQALYGHGDMRRIVAREHTSLLETKTRLAHERGFKSSGQKAGAPNVLVATPTLEMGIDIGTLSAVFLSSLPRTTASYLQRVGRAGRRTGNALDVTYITGHRANLPRLLDPLAMINGAVRPPATWLSAEEILRRQYLAHIVDKTARDHPDLLPRVAPEALAPGEHDTFLGHLITQAEKQHEQLLATFLGTFSSLQDDAITTLREWATPPQGPGSSGLARQLYAAANRWTNQVEALQRRLTSIQQALPDLQQRASLPNPDSEDSKALRSARAALHYTIQEISDSNRQHWVSALEEVGLLPNYTLLDDSVRLEVLVTWLDPDSQEWKEDGATISRPSARALHEFAPGNTFYARGMEIAIDAVDLGPNTEAVHPWSYCADCGWAVDLMLADAGDCPRCGSDTPRDAGQRLNVVELTKVSAQLNRDEAVITDSGDERRRTRFSVVAAPDIDQGHVRREWYVQGYDFGVQYLDRLTMRWVNVGRISAGGDMQLAGQKARAPLFRVCRACGVLDQAARANSPREHRPWCQHRQSTDENHVVNVALSRTLTTQGVVIPLPHQVTLGDSFAVPSLTAALLLGLREQFGGSPDHLGVTTCVAPNRRGSNHQALLIHDVVPGGTGYLADLASPERAWNLLLRAWRIVRDCPCQAEGQLACPLCLLPFAPGHEVHLVSRSAAERHLRDILTGGHSSREDELDDPMLWQVTQQAHEVSDDGASWLEKKFYVQLKRLAESLSAQVTEQPGPRGNQLQLSLPGQRRTWTLKPQVDLLGCRPDFLLSTPDPNVPDMAIFTDGYQFHGTAAHNNLADDATKRQVLRDHGLFVLSVTAEDVRLYADEQPARAPRWYPSAVEPVMIAKFPRCSSLLPTVTGGPFAILERWLREPDREACGTLAQALSTALFGVNQRTVQPLEVRQLTRALLTGESIPGQTAIGWWSESTLGIAVVRDGSILTTCAAVDDRTHALGSEEAKEAWRDWLALANALQFGIFPVLATTVRQIIKGTARVVSADPALVKPQVPGWDEAYDNSLSDDERLLVVALADAGLAVAEQGHEVGDQPIDFAWPDQQIAVFIDGHTDDTLVERGWTVLGPDIDRIKAALSGGGQ